MSAFENEVIDLAAWTAAAGWLSLCVGVKIGRRVQRWTSLDERTDRQQDRRDSYEFGWADGYDVAKSDYGIDENSPRFCNGCSDVHPETEPCRIPQPTLFND